VKYPSIASLKTAVDFRARLDALGVTLPFDETVQVGAGSWFSRPSATRQGTIGNRFAVLPMEGWDGTADGGPSELTRRRWRRFGASGAKLIWGGEAVAVRPDGRANPNQLLLDESTLPEIAGLLDDLKREHQEHFGSTDDLLVGLQLTHSGRFARPEKGRPRPRILYRRPYLDARFGVADDSALLSDEEISRLIEDFVAAARRAQRAGFDFVDVKHCHGYLGHEFLSAVDRPGRYGGSLENRTRFLREVVSGIHAEASGLEIGVRVSVFDFVPFEAGPDGVGAPAGSGWDDPYAFGGDGSGLGIDLTEPLAFLDLLERWEIELVCSTAGSPYYNPHIQRPASFPPSDGYLPPEDPLVGVARQINATAELKSRRLRLLIVGSGYSLLQEWLPNIAQGVLRSGGADFIGLGRMMLAYPEFPADVLAGRPLARKRICRTFSDCTTAPRNGLVSGCFPLDGFYKALPDAERLVLVKSRTPS
jgi:NADPH2 dehydrogenase